MSACHRGDRKKPKKTQKPCWSHVWCFSTCMTQTGEQSRSLQEFKAVLRVEEALRWIQFFSMFMLPRVERSECRRFPVTFVNVDIAVVSRGRQAFSTILRTFYSHDPQTQRRRRRRTWRHQAATHSQTSTQSRCCTGIFLNLTCFCTLSLSPPPCTITAASF